MVQTHKQTTLTADSSLNADTSILCAVFSISLLILDTLNFTLMVGLDGCSALADGVNSKETPCQTEQQLQSYYKQ